MHGTHISAMYPGPFLTIDNALYANMTIIVDEVLHSLADRSNCRLNRHSEVQIPPADVLTGIKVKWFWRKKLTVLQVWFHIWNHLKRG